MNSRSRCRRTLGAVVMLGLAASVTSATAQTAALAAVPVHLTGERGVSIELLGLQRWTPAMLRDSIDRLGGGASVASRGFALTLRNKLRFRDAFVGRIPGDSAINLLIAVIEPGDSAHGTRRTLASDTAGTLWPDLVPLIRKAPELLPLGTRLAYARSVGLPPVYPVVVRTDSAKIKKLWAFLEAHRTPDAVAKAKQVLTTSPNVYDRVTAVAILGNVEEDDASWHALVGALLDPDARVNELALAVLASWSAELPRPVNWKGAEADLRTIVSGSAVYAIPALLDVLIATRIDPAFAAELLGNDGLGLRIFAGSQRPAIRRSTYRFLRLANEASGLSAGWQGLILGGAS